MKHIHMSSTVYLTLAAHKLKLVSYFAAAQLVRSPLKMRQSVDKQADG